MPCEETGSYCNLFQGLFVLVPSPSSPSHSPRAVLSFFCPDVFTVFYVHTHALSILLRRERHARHDPLVVTPNPRLIYSLLCPHARSLNRSLATFLDF